MYNCLGINQEEFILVKDNTKTLSKQNIEYFFWLFLWNMSIVNVMDTC